MRYRYLLLTIVLFISVQYLYLSELGSAALLPELGLLAIILVRRQFGPIEIIAAALMAGYLADVIGSVEQGSLMAGYLAAAILLSAIKNVESMPRPVEIILSASGSLLIFHLVVGLVASPVFIASLLSTVIVQTIGAIVLIQVNGLVQSIRRPA